MHCPAVGLAIVRARHPGFSRSISRALETGVEFRGQSLPTHLPAAWGICSPRLFPSRRREGGRHRPGTGLRARRMLESVIAPEGLGRTLFQSAGDTFRTHGAGAETVGLLSCWRSTAVGRISRTARSRAPGSRGSWPAEEVTAYSSGAMLYYRLMVDFQNWAPRPLTRVRVIMLSAMIIERVAPLCIRRHRARHRHFKSASMAPRCRKSAASRRAVARRA